MLEKEDLISQICRLKEEQAHSKRIYNIELAYLRGELSNTKRLLSSVWKRKDKAEERLLEFKKTQFNLPNEIPEDFSPLFISIEQIDRESDLKHEEWMKLFEEEN